MTVKEARRILNIQGPYTAQTLKAAFRKESRKAHPDLHPELENADELMRRVLEANNELKKYLPKEDGAFADPLDIDIPNFNRTQGYNSEIFKTRKAMLLKELDEYAILPRTMPSNSTIASKINDILSNVKRIRFNISAALNLDALNRNFKNLHDRLVKYNETILASYKSNYSNVNFENVNLNLSLKDFVDSLEKIVFKQTMFTDIMKKIKERYESKPGYNILYSQIKRLATQFYQKIVGVGEANKAFFVFAEPSLYKQIDELFDKWPIYEERIRKVKDLRIKVNEIRSLILFNEVNTLDNVLFENDFDKLFLGISCEVNKVSDKTFKQDVYTEMQKNCSGALKNCEKKMDFGKAAEIYEVLKRAANILKLHDVGFIVYDDIIDLISMDFDKPNSAHEVMDFMTNSCEDKINPAYIYVKEDSGLQKWLAYVTYENEKYYFVEIGNRNIYAQKRKREIYSPKDIPEGFVSILSFLIEGKFIGRKFKGTSYSIGMVDVLYQYKDLSLIIDGHGNLNVAKSMGLKDTGNVMDNASYYESPISILSMVRQTAETLYKSKEKKQ